MQRRLWKPVLLLCLGVACAAPAVADDFDVRAEIQRIYDFQPRTLDSATRHQKSALLDKFWSKAEGQRGIYIPWLRRELAEFSNPPFFLYDGSKLLLKLSQDPADHKIVLQAIAHSDLRDLQQLDYMLFVHHMAVLGEDTTAAALHILDDPEFSVVVPDHAMILGQGYSLIYMLLPTKQEYWQHPAIQRLDREKDEKAQKSLLLLLWYAQTPDADEAMERFSRDAAKPESARSYANELARRKDDAEPRWLAAATAAGAGSSEEEIRQIRQNRVAVVSDFALEALEFLTYEIVAKRK